MVNPAAPSDEKSDLVPALGARASPRDFFTGLLLPFRAAGLVFRNGKLLTLALVCAAVTVITLGAVIFLVFHYADPLTQWIWTRPDAWYGQAAWWLLKAAVVLLLLGVGANTLPLLALTPLQDPLSEATEQACGGFVPSRFSLTGLVRGTAVSLGHTALRVVTLLAGHAVLFALNLIPVVGSVTWTVLGTLWTALWAAGEYLDGPMTRHLYPFREVRRVLTRRIPLALGFGLSLYVLLWVPVLNFFLVPLAVVAGTLLFRGLLLAGELKPPAAAPAPEGQPPSQTQADPA